jgi:hypothetical protein
MLVLLCLLAHPSFSIAEDLWTQLEAATDKCFKKPYYVIVKGETGEEVKVFIDVSKETRMKRKAYVEAAAEIIKELEMVRAEIAVQERMEEVLKQAMLQEGMGGIKKYFDIQKEMAKLKVEEEATLRKFNRQIAECEVDTQEEVQEATEENKNKDETVKTSWTDMKE